ncbi:MAG: class I SAM-dependent methyltransferase [Paenalcaligenes sp.]
MEQARTEQLMQWQHTVPGRHARAWMHRQVNALVGNTFGYHAIQIGLPHWDLLRANRIANKFCTVDTENLHIVRKGLVICVPEQLPFESESVDLMVLPHALECSEQPHQILREVERVLRPEGKAIFAGLNPYSLWGLRDRIPGLESHLPVAPAQYVSQARLEDWLELLSFDVTQANQGVYMPYCQSRRWLHRWAFMDTLALRGWPLSGAVYVVEAIKRVSAAKMVGLEWKRVPPKFKSRAVAAARRDANI